MSKKECHCYLWTLQRYYTCSRHWLKYMESIYWWKQYIWIFANYLWSYWSLVVIHDDGTKVVQRWRSSGQPYKESLGRHLSRHMAPWPPRERPSMHHTFWDGSEAEPGWGMGQMNGRERKRMQGLKVSSKLSWYNINHYGKLVWNNLCKTTSDVLQNIWWTESNETPQKCGLVIQSNSGD